MINYKPFILLGIIGFLLTYLFIRYEMKQYDKYPYSIGDGHRYYRTNTFKQDSLGNLHFTSSNGNQVIIHGFYTIHKY